MARVLNNYILVALRIRNQIHGSGRNFLLSRAAETTATRTFLIHFIIYKKINAAHQPAHV